MYFAVRRHYNLPQLPFLSHTIPTINLLPYDINDIYSLRKKETGKLGKNNNKV